MQSGAIPSLADSSSMSAHEVRSASHCLCVNRLIFTPAPNEKISVSQHGQVIFIGYSCNADREGCWRTAPLKERCSYASRVRRGSTVWLVGRVVGTPGLFIVPRQIA